jgi:hypothetical protein
MGIGLMAQSGRALSVSPAGHGSIPEMRTLLLSSLLAGDRKYPENGSRNALHSTIVIRLVCATLSFDGFRTKCCRIHKTILKRME